MGKPIVSISLKIFISTKIKKRSMFWVSECKVYAIFLDVYDRYFCCQQLVLVIAHVYAWKLNLVFNPKNVILSWLLDCTSKNDL